MDDSRDAETEPEQTSYMRLPWPLVAVGLVGVLAVALAIGLFANRYLRPQLEPAATPLTAAAPPTTAVPSATPVPVISAPTPAPTPSPAPTSVPQAPANPTGTPPPAPTQTPAVATASVRPTLDPVAVAEVGAAYEQYWGIRTQALLELDKTHLPEVMGGDHLKSIADLIDELKDENRAIKTDVDHESHIVQITSDTAQVLDDYISKSIYVDPLTKEALSQPGSDELRVLYRLTKSNGTWRVVDSVRPD